MNRKSHLALVATSTRQIPRFTPKGRERIAHILDVATKMVMTNGFANITLRDVAKQSGVTLSNIQYYFATYEGLVEAILQHMRQRYDKGFWQHILISCRPDARPSRTLNRSSGSG